MLIKDSGARAAGAAASAARSPRSHAIVAAGPVMLVNAVAFIGQYMYVHKHMPWIVPGQVMFAVALETVAVYLAWQAHLAAMKNDSAMRLRLGAYIFACGIGAMNYSHYAAPHWRPTFPAVGLFLMSALSPWLWGVHTRRVSRDELMAKGQLEGRSLRLGATRWLWHAIRSARAMYHATWIGETNVARAIDATDAERTARLARRAARRPRAAVPPVPPEPPAPVSAPQPEQAAISGAPAAAELNGAPARQSGAVRATARLQAAPALSGAKPPQDLIDAAARSLAALPVGELPSVRYVARELLGNENCRRTAERLLGERRAAVQSAPRLQPVRTQFIASPAGFLPGGVSAVE